MSYTIKNPEEFRESIRNKLKSILLKETTLRFTENCPINLEKGVYNYAIKEANIKKIVKSWQNVSFCQLYIDRLRTVYFNLKPEMIALIANKEIKPQEVAFMTHQEFDATKWKDLIEKKIKRDDSKFNVKVESSTSLFTCKKCGSKKCTYYELQIRSADEPATVFITCLDCGKNWKI
jgi:DNA-directed RNA polymerase subunit M/transcription elongation factor TFIIS